MFTIETLKKAMPSQMKKRLDQQLCDEINRRLSDPDMKEAVVDNFISYCSVLQDGRFKMSAYLDAVQFCTHMMLGDGVLQAWVKTFPDRYARLIANNCSDKDISAHASMYRGNQLVNLIMAQAMIPTHLINAHYFQEAINKQVELMRTARSERIQMEAAGKLMDTLKAPEIKKIELDVGSKSSSMIEELKQQTALLAAQQQRLIEGGVSTAQNIAHQQLIIEGEINDD